MRKWILAVLVVGLLAGTQQAEAMFLVNTGPGGFAGPDSHVYPGISQRDIVVTGRFYLEERSTITGLEAWVWNGGLTPAGEPPNFEKPVGIFLIRGDSTNIDPFNPSPVPGLGSKGIYGAKFFVPPSDHADWHGINGLNIDVEPGAYWIGIGPPEPVGSITDGVFMPAGGENPLSDYAAAVNGPYLNTKDNPKYNTFAEHRAFRVSGQANPVPEPSTMGMMLFGLAGLAGKKKFFG